MLTFCGSFEDAAYTAQDLTLSMINTAFNGPYEAVSFEPFVLAGAQSIAEVPFLHTAICLPPVIVPHPRPSILDDMPTAFALQQNYPNPFNPATTISFTLVKPGYTTLKIFNIVGKEVDVLVSESLNAGTFSKRWNASGYASGVYFYRVTAIEEENGKTFSAVKKMMLAR